MAKKITINDDIDIEELFRNASPGTFTPNGPQSERASLSEHDRLKRIRARFSEAMGDGSTDSPVVIEDNELQSDSGHLTVMATMGPLPKVVPCSSEQTNPGETNTDIINQEKSTEPFPIGKEKDVQAKTTATIATETADVAEPIIVNQMTSTVDVTNPTEAGCHSSPSDVEAKSPKITRISGKMRRATRDEFCGIFTRKVNTKGGSPITIAPDILKTAYLICAKSGNYRSCPTYVINNILRAFFDDMAEEIKSWPMPE